MTNTQTTKQNKDLTNKNIELLEAVKEALRYLKHADRKERKASEREVLCNLALHTLITAVEQTDEYVRMLEQEGGYDGD